MHWEKLSRGNTMLKVYLGDCENEVYNPPVYFKNQYEDSWLETDLAKYTVKWTM